MNTITLDVTLARHEDRPNIYGHFSEHLGRCIYEGYWVGPDSPIRTSVASGETSWKRSGGSRCGDALAGGCFADEYHWRDGIGPHEDGPRW